jgi:hypothetical protein
MIHDYIYYPDYLRDGDYAWRLAFFGFWAWGMGHCGMEFWVFVIIGMGNE